MRRRYGRDALSSVELLKKRNKKQKSKPWRRPPVVGKAGGSKAFVQFLRDLRPQVEQAQPDWDKEEVYRHICRRWGLIGHEARQRFQQMMKRTQEDTEIFDARAY